MPAKEKKTDADSEDRLKDGAEVAPASPPKPATEVDSLVKQEMAPDALPAPAPAESGQLASGGRANAQAP
ncbi:MAG: trigger factor, partial [Mesorhizobium sp.]